MLLEDWCVAVYYYLRHVPEEGASGHKVAFKDALAAYKTQVAKREEARAPLALIVRPKRTIGGSSDYGPGSAPVQLFEKTKAHAASLDADVIVLDDEHANAGFARRRAWAFKQVSALVDAGHVRTSRRVVSYLPQRYAKYVRERLETLGCTVEEPTKGMNMGQKLAYLTHPPPSTQNAEL